MVKIENVSQFIEQIMCSKSKTDDDPNQIFWFRGESSTEFQSSLVPNEYRVLSETLKIINNKKFLSKNIKNIEGNINAKFYRKSFRYLKEMKVKNSFTNRYFLQQHYGIPTRLLDWSENALIALYFAVCENYEYDGKVWILDPFELNNQTFQNILVSQKNCRYIPSVSNNIKKKDLHIKGKFRIEEITRRYLKMDFIMIIWELKNLIFPSPVYPPFLESRIQSQSGCFTLFGNEIEGLTSIDNGTFLNSVIINKLKKNTIIKELSMIGISKILFIPV